MGKELLFIFFILTFLQHQNKSYSQNQGAESKTEGLKAAKHQPGENFGGGKIFWLDDTGQHGLIAAISDQSAKGIAWNPGKGVVTDAGSDTLYSGLANSEKIQRSQGTTNQYAARLCLEYTITVNNVVYNDWYLPSKFELNLLYQQKSVIGGFNIGSGIYWSSTENNETTAWEQEFKFGSQYEDDKDMTDQVRCIRKF